MAFDIQKHREVTDVQTKQDSALGIMRWGTSNSFPQTMVNLIKKSANGRPVVDRTAKFYKGGTFEGENTIVSPYGLTLKDVVSILADDLAHLEGFALHSNFNMRGETSGINPMRIAELRFNEFDELNYANKIGYHENFGMNSNVQRTVTKSATRSKIKWFDRYNPDAVLMQIDKAESIGNYLGQILYHSASGHSSYPEPKFQAPINYLLADIENSILVRKETATGFVDSWLLKSSLSSTDPNLVALETSIEQAQGARGAGKVITFADMPEEDVKNTVLERIGGTKDSSIIDSSTKGYELAHRVLSGAYLIPPVLAGADVKTGFNTQALEDAYFVFNSITQDGRNAIENAVNRMLANSVFDIKKIKLSKIKLDSIENQDDDKSIKKEKEDV